MYLHLISLSHSYPSPPYPYTQNQKHMSIKHMSKIKTCISKRHVYPKDM